MICAYNHVSMVNNLLQHGVAVIVDHAVVNEVFPAYMFVSDIVVFVLKRDVKLQPTNSLLHGLSLNHQKVQFHSARSMDHRPRRLQSSTLRTKYHGLAEMSGFGLDAAVIKLLEL